MKGNSFLFGARQSVIMFIIICFIFLFAFDYGLLVDAQIFDKIGVITSELQAIKEEKFDTAELYLTQSKHSNADTHLIYYSEATQKVKAYNVKIGHCNYEQIYVPDYISFELDTDFPYKESEDWEVNKEYASYYKVTYTPNFHIVIAIETLPPKGPEWHEDNFSNLTGVTGYNRAITDEMNHKWSRRETHIEFSEQSSMDFTWKAPKLLGCNRGIIGKQFVFTDGDVAYQTRFFAWIPTQYYDGIIEDVQKAIIYIYLISIRKLYMRLVISAILIILTKKRHIELWRV